VCEVSNERSKGRVKKHRIEKFGKGNTQQYTGTVKREREIESKTQKIFYILFTVDNILYCVYDDEF
jgi:hypothetical protein